MSDSHRPKHPFKPRFGAEETCVYCYEPADSPFHVIRKVPEADNPIYDPFGGVTPKAHEFVAVDDDPDRCVVCCRGKNDVSHLRWKAEHPDPVPGEMDSRVEQRAYRYEVVRKLAEKLYLMDVYGAHPDFDDADQLLQNTYVGKARALIADPDLRVELR